MFETNEEKREFKLLYFFIAITAFFYFMYIEAYGAIFAYILFVGFYEIVVMNKRFQHLKDYAESFI